VNFNHTVADHIFSPILAGNLAVNKLGNGTTALTGNNSYTQGTVITAGTLAAQSPSALGTGHVDLNNNGVLAIGSFASGLANMTLSVGGNLSWSSNSSTIALLNGASANITGSLSSNGVVGNRTFDVSQYGVVSNNTITLARFGSSDIEASGNSTANATFDITFTGLSQSSTVVTTGNFVISGGFLRYVISSATANGSSLDIRNSDADFIVDSPTTAGTTVVTGQNPLVKDVIFQGSNNLVVPTGIALTVFGQEGTAAGQLNVQSGTSSILSGSGTIEAPNGLNKVGSGELDLQTNTNVTGVATVVAGLLSVNSQLNANSVVVDPNATLGGAGVIVASNVIVNGNLSPGNSPGTLNVVGNLVLTGANSTLIEIASPTNFDRIVVTGTATLGGTLNAVGYGGYSIAPGSRFDFLQAGSIVGAYDSIVAPEGLRARFLSSGTVGTLLFGPGSYVPMAINQNQRNVAKALDTFIVATDGNRLAVSIALDSLTTEQFPAAFDQIMPGFYESLADIAIEQAFNQTQMLNQRISSVRLGAAGFQAIGGITQPLVHDKNGKSAAEAKDANPIVESATATNWNAWALGTGMFSRTTNLGSLQNYNNDAGGFLVGSDYRWSENFVTGLYAGYDYSYAEYNGGGSTKGNSFSFGTYASYEKDGYYADAVIGGGYTGFQTKRSVKFSTIDRTASADPNSGQFTAGLNLGKDFEVGKFTLGPIVGAQYTYAGIGSFTESGAESLDLSLGQQNANSLRTTLGGRIAYTWNMNQKIAFIPEVRMFWQHEFLNNPRNISSSLDGGSGAAFDFETSDPYRDSVFAGAGVTAQFGKNLSGSVFYNINFGSQTYQSNMVSAGLNFSF
jgi:outer membrane autotransporter protein